jgi:hypothetical protein
MVGGNPMRGEASIGEGAGAFTLVLDVNAWCHIQSTLGLKVTEVISAFEADPADMLTARAMLWGALQKNHACHLVEAGEIMADHGPSAVREALAACLEACFGTVKSEGKKRTDPRKKATPGTG